MTLTFSANPAPYNTSVVMTATVTDATHAGTVSFYDLTNPNSPVTVCANVAPAVSGTLNTYTCNYTPPVAGGGGGSFAMEDTYSGDVQYGFANNHKTLVVNGAAAATVRRGPRPTPGSRARPTP